MTRVMNKIYAFLLLPLVLLLMQSCRATERVVEVSSVNGHSAHTTLAILHDSIYLRDSIHVSERGCTLEVTRWKVERHVIRDLQRDTLRDTLYINHDRNVEKVVKVKYVPKILKIALAMMSIPFIYMLYNMFLRKRQK